MAENPEQEGLMEPEGIDSSLPSEVNSVENEQNSVPDVNDFKEDQLHSFLEAEPSTAESVVGGGETVLIENASTADGEAEKLNGDEDNEEDDDQGDGAFVDAMDQLNVSDGRSIDIGDSTVYVETQANLEDRVVVREEAGADDSTQVRQLMYELSLLQASLDKTVGDKEIAEQKYKEERETVRSELVSLHRQLEVLADRQPLLVENGNGVVERLRQAEKEDEGKLHDSDVPLETVISNCSKFAAVLKSTLDEQLQSEGTIRELHAVLYAKDQEIEELYAKVNELSLSHDVTVSYFESLQSVWSQSLKETSEVNFERDRNIEAVTERLLSSLALVVQLDDLSDGSVADRIFHVERGTSLLIEYYNWFLSESDNLKQCLTGAVTEIKLPDEMASWTVFDMVRGELLGHKRKELDFIDKMNQFEVENKKLLEQLDEEKERIKMVDAELRQIKLELEQEKNKSASTKEKLSLAVTKGKALVQHRDSLKQSLSEKTNELEKCLLELEEKSKALDSAELQMEDLGKTESLTASLQVSLSEREAVLKEIENILSKTDMANNVESLDVSECVRSLVDHRNVLLGVSMEYDQLKHSLASLNLPDTVASYELGSQINWLWESLSVARDDLVTLQGEIISTQVSLASHESQLTEAYDEIEHLKESLSAEKLEKDSLQMGLENLSSKYEAIVEREFQVSSEKDRMVQMFLDASGMEDQGGGHETYSGIAAFIDNCIGKIREQTIASFKSSDNRKEQFEDVQSLLYVRDQELMLCTEMLEEENLEVTKISNELIRVSQELVVLKEEKDSLQKDVERSDEKIALIREKLSMAVKKGKGLFQEREGLKRSLDEKNTETENLKLELQQQESVISGCKDQINRLSNELEQIPKLESDLVITKDQRDQLEKFLLESNSMLQKVVESIESVALPVETSFEEPVEKVKYLVECFNEYHAGKAHAERELEKVKEDAISLTSKFAESNETIRSLQDALSELEKNKSLLEEEKKDILVDKTYVEQELEKAKEEASSQTSKFADTFAHMKSLEEALSLAEKSISMLGEEKEAAHISRSQAEEELEKVREEAIHQAGQLAETNITIKSLEEAFIQVKSLEDAVSSAEKHISMLGEEKEAANVAKSHAEEELEKVREETIHQAGKLTEANITIKSLEEALIQVEKNVSALTEEKEAAEIARASLEKQLEEVKRTADSQASKLTEAYASVKSLEEALSKTDNNISALLDGKKEAEKEIKALNTRLRENMEQLSGTHGNLESQSTELFGHLNHLNVIMKDDAFLSQMTLIFKKKIVRLRGMKFLLENIQERVFDKGSEELQTNLHTEEDPYVMKLFSENNDVLPNGTIDDTETCKTNLSDILSYSTKIGEGFKKKNKLLGDNFESFSTSMDQLIADLFQALQETRDNVTGMLEHMESLKVEVKDLEAHKQTQESVISKLKNDMAMVLSACADVATELQFEGDNNRAGLSSNWEAEKLNPGLQSRSREGSEDAVAEHKERLGDVKHVKDAEVLVSVAREVRDRLKELENVKAMSLMTIEDLQNKLEESNLTSETAIEERDLNQERVSMLEKDLEELQNICDEMNLKIQDYHSKEDMLREQEGKISSLYHYSSKTEQDADGCSLSESQMKTLFEKLNQIEFPMEGSDIEKPEFHCSSPVKKLYFIVDSFAESQHQINLLFRDKEELKSSVLTQGQEMGHLKKEVESLSIVNQELGKVKSELNELTLDLEKLIQKLGGDNLVEGKEFVGVKGFYPVLENLIMAITLECETLRSKAKESDARLLENQKVVNDLSVKVKLLEGSNNTRPAVPDPISERSIASSFAAGSEISEIEEAGPLGRNSISPAPSAAHVRTMKKGSTDHLALNIDPESDRLIEHPETDDDKGHLFKSLNTSGLIPKQGKLIADRVDGIWVSGGRVLMSRPRARIGVIVYCLFLHIWLLGAIL